MDIDDVKRPLTDKSALKGSEASGPSSARDNLYKTFETVRFVQFYSFMEYCAASCICFQSEAPQKRLLIS